MAGERGPLEVPVEAALLGGIIRDGDVEDITTGAPILPIAPLFITGC